MANDGLVQSGYSRVWIIKRPGPAAELLYLGCAKIGDPSWPQGDVTDIECPDPARYNEFLKDPDGIVGARGRVTFPINSRYDFGYSDLLKIARERCGFDVRVLIGKCKNPSDFKSGWEKMLALPSARLTTYALENLGAIESGERNPTNENVDVSAVELFELLPTAFSELCASTVARELTAVTVCDQGSCGGGCGPYSDGCSKVFAVEIGTGATPGTLPSVVYSGDGGETCGSVDINTMFSNETPEDAACVGDNLVVIASTANSIHWATTANILSGVAAPFTEVTGFAGISPRAMWSNDSQHTWIVGDSGYIWFASDPTAGVDAQSNGDVTTQNFRDVHASDNDNVVAVGANNAIVYTTNGGVSWVAATGPTPGVGLNAVYVFSADVWLVGNAAGALYVTENHGTTWTVIALPGSLGAIQDIVSPGSGVFYLAGTSGATGKILKSTAYGAAGTWYLLPEKSGSIPAADRFNMLAVCAANPNVVFGAGLGDNGTDGIFVKAA